MSGNANGRTEANGQDRLVVHYPSGARLSLRGSFALLDGPDGLLPVIDTGSEVVVLDPRAVILGPVGMVYHPADMPPDRLAPWVRDWLRDAA